jgi:hypothetical protein
MGWIYLVQYWDEWRALVNMVMNEHSGSIKDGEFFD